MATREELIAQRAAELEREALIQERAQQIALEERSGGSIGGLLDQAVSGANEGMLVDLPAFLTGGVADFAANAINLPSAAAAGLGLIDKETQAKLTIPADNEANLRRQGRQLLETIGLVGSKPRGQAERVARTAGEFAGSTIGTLGSGTALKVGQKAPALASFITQQPVTQIVGSTAGGTAGGIAKEIAPESPTAQIAASAIADILASAGTQVSGQVGKRTARAIGEAFKPSKASVKSTAKEALIDIAQDENLGAKLADAIDDPFVTTAEVSKNPNISALEKQLGQRPENAPRMAGRALARQERREGLIGSKLKGKPQTKAQAGEVIREGLEKQAAEFGDEFKFGKVTKQGKVSEAFEKAKLNDTGVFLFDIKKEVKKEVENLFGKKGRKMSSETRELVSQVMDDQRELWSLDDVQRIQGFAGDLATDLAEKQKTRRDSRLAAFIKGRFDDAIEKNIDANLNQPGLVDGAENLRAANKVRTEQATRFETGVSKDILKGKFKGEVRIPDEEIVSKATSSPKNARNIVRGLGSDKESLTSLQRATVEKLVTESKDAGGEITRAKFVKNLKDRKAVLEELRLSDKQIEALEFVANDLQSEAKGQKLAAFASRGNSGTQQFQSFADFFTATVNSKAAQFVPAASWLGSLAEFVASKKAKQVEALLMEAVLDPRFADDLLSAPTPAKAESILSVLKNTAKVRVTGSAQTSEPARD